MSGETRAVLGLILLSGLIACSGLQPSGPSATPPLRASETPAEPEVMSDTFFSGCAYLDQNGNEAIDPEDPLLGGMTFTVTLAGGAGFGGETSDGQCAFITVPATLPAEAWPNLARITVPEGDAYEAIGPTQVMLQYPQTRAEFLFEAK